MSDTEFPRWWGEIPMRVGFVQSAHGLIWFGPTVHGWYCTACGDRQPLEGSADMMGDAAEAHAEVCPTVAFPPEETP